VGKGTNGYTLAAIPPIPMTTAALMHLARPERWFWLVIYVFMANRVEGIL